MPRMFLNGGAMRGGPLHHLLRDAPFVAAVRTAPRYRFYSVGDRFPAIAEVDSRTVIGEAVSVIGEGVSVLGELYDVPWDVLRDSLLPAEPAALELGVIELEDGSGTLSMVLRRTYCPEGSPAGLYRDISGYADWRSYTASLGAATVPPGE